MKSPDDTAGAKNSTEPDREQFLLHMYDQMWNNISRHILVVWQSIGVLVAALALFSLVEKLVVTLDIAVGVLVMVCAWLIAHTIDAAYWFDRNLAIISNIERQFLRESDLRDIHPYFNRHRPGTHMIEHLLIQKCLGVAIWVLVFGYHFSERLTLRYVAPSWPDDVRNYLPIIVSVVCLGLLAWLRWHLRGQYADFLEKSPGIGMGREGAADGIGSAASSDTES